MQVISARIYFAQLRHRQENTNINMESFFICVLLRNACRVLILSAMFHIPPSSTSIKRCRSSCQEVVQIKVSFTTFISSCSNIINFNYFMFLIYKNTTSIKMCDSILNLIKVNAVALASCPKYIAFCLCSQVTLSYKFYEKFHHQHQPPFVNEVTFSSNLPDYSRKK